MRKQFIRRKRLHVWAMPGLRLGVAIVPRTVVHEQFKQEFLIWLGPILIGWKFASRQPCTACGGYHEHSFTRPISHRKAGR